MGIDDHRSWRSLVIGLLWAKRGEQTLQRISLTAKEKEVQANNITNTAYVDV